MDTDILRDFVAGAWAMRWLFVSLYAFGVTALAYLWRADRDEAYRTQIVLATRSSNLQRRLDSSLQQTATLADRLATAQLTADDVLRDTRYVEDRLPEWLKGGE